MWQKVAKFKGAEYFRKALYMHTCTTACTPQVVGGTLIGEDRLVVMAGAEKVEWCQIH